MTKSSLASTTLDAQVNMLKGEQAELDKAPVVIQFEHVSKLYKLYRNERRRLLGLFSKRVAHKTISANDDLSFIIHKGQSVALLGANGAGKSTALKLITGVIFPTQGTVTVHGSVNALLELKAGFDKSLTGRENIHLRLHILGMSENQIAEIEPRILKFAHIGTYIDQPLRTYSSGMRARLGFAIVSFIKSDILVVDEALSVGDRRFARKCQKRVRRLMKSDELTVLFVTHNSEAARKFCDWGIVFEQGRKIYEGDIDSAIRFYENEEDSDEVNNETGKAMSETGKAMSETGKAMSETGKARSETGKARSSTEARSRTVEGEKEN